jgi:uncharacterized protein (DUF1778 family)
MLSKEKYTETIIIKLTTTDRQELTAAAEAAGLRLSDFVRQAIDQAIARQKNTAEASDPGGAAAQVQP